MSLAIQWRLAQVVTVLANLRVRLDAHIVWTNILRIDMQLEPLGILLLEVLNKCVEVDPEDLEVLFAHLQLVDHLIRFVERDVLLPAEIKKGLVRLLEVELVGT